ncbi:type I restriction enzyme, S subunit [Actinacidiphila alni]|uniref:Type I restriction enzyme, S subunit n=1 Tax=Actinacidiphila alni TaxID=380248 RepID=A0A1I2JCG1_9ACTN|nr:restriction endonuclease subunit S [Actinacidiphila alni]SFF52532.1 type I restriction enzyme, S subunit [Actinacidiphila alni]
MTPTVPLKRVTRMAYGDSLAADMRTEGEFPIVGSGGISGSHNAPNFRAPGIVIGRKGSYGSLHWVPTGGFAIDTAYYIDERLTSADLRWLYYALHAVDLRSPSQDVGVPGLSREAAYDASVPTPPPLKEQRRIADFLDAETSRIDRLAELGERQVYLLRERSEAIVAQFFGPGDGRREYRFRHLMESNPCYGVLVPKFADVGVPLIRVSDLGKLDHDLVRLPRIEEGQAQEYRRTCISPGDLLITVVGATIGRCDVAPAETAGFNVSRALARVKLAAGISPQLIASWVRSRGFQIQAELATSGAAAQPALNMSDITHFTVWLPETHSGRRDLAYRVSTHEEENRRLLTAIGRKQSLVAERRQALITAAVTGQIDVSTASGRGIED